MKPHPTSGRRTVGELLVELIVPAPLFAPPEEVATAGGTDRLSFEHLYPLCYLSQDMANGREQVRGSANTPASYKAVVELLLHLTDLYTRVLTRG
ncbi:hypothetical protein [Kitasatospora sp. NPDC050543]|uniref:hypothetical protein n=1 Tax=Kitasatospora sp. NPDC050543 TaxID=3364054 RepID=UPI0037AB4ECC